jgi:hypothetical protein
MNTRESSFDATPNAVGTYGGSAWFTGGPTEEAVQAGVAAPSKRGAPVRAAGLHRAWEAPGGLLLPLNSNTGNRTMRFGGGKRVLNCSWSYQYVTVSAWGRSCCGGGTYVRARHGSAGVVRLVELLGKWFGRRSSTRYSTMSYCLRRPNLLSIATRPYFTQQLLCTSQQRQGGRQNF